MKSFSGLLVIFLFFITYPIKAQSISEVVDEGKKISNMATSSQEKIDDLAGQIQDKLAQFKSINKETEGLKVYNKQMENQLVAQSEEMLRLNESIDQVTVIERQITPLMLKMIDALEELVSFDVPFLPEERAQRLANLNEMMDRADVAVSEKFRRILEAYQVEIDYGRTIEAYTGNVELNNESQVVNFLRIGRVAFIYQSRDKSNMGIWNKQTNSWEPLDESYRIQVTKGLRMAQKQLAPDMIVVPVPAAELK